MALIIDPDLLTDKAVDDDTTEVFIDTTAKTIKLTVVGNLSTDGVTLQALYSFLKEEWRTDPFSKNLAAFDFPMVPITDESFEFVAGWDLLNNTGRYLIRTAGWNVRNVAGNVTQQWTGIIGLGNVEAGDQLYYQQEALGSTTNVQLTGQVNQAVQTLRDDDGDGNYAEGSDYDRRTVFNLFVREQGQSYGVATIANAGATSLGPQVYRFPISTGTDLKITHTDVQIDANSDNVADVAPYTGMSITYFATAQARVIGGVSRNFGIIIDGNGGTAEEIYEFVQWSLRRTTDIDADAGSVIGKTADELLRFTGDALKTLSATNSSGGGTGVYIDDFQLIDTNRLTFTDNLGVERVYPFIAIITINFGANLVADASAKYWMYFTTLPGAGNDFGEAGALLVDDNDGVDIAGDVSGAPSVEHTFSYDSNVQGGRTPAEDAAVTVVAIGLGTGQHVKATATIGRSTTNSVSLVAALERSYQNP